MVPTHHWILFWKTKITEGWKLYSLGILNKCTNLFLESLKIFSSFFQKKKIIPSQSPLQESKSKSKQPINRVRFFVLLSLDRYVISYHLGRNFGPFKICQFFKNFFYIIFSQYFFCIIFFCILKKISFLNYKFTRKLRSHHFAFESKPELTPQPFFTSCR